MNRLNLLFVLIAATFSSCAEEQKHEQQQVAQQANDQHQPSVYPEISAYTARIGHYANDTSAAKYDSLESVNAQLMRYLENIGSQPFVLQEPMNDVDSTGIMHIVTSADNKFRIYCWNTLTGGTMRFFNCVVQYATPGGSNAHVLNDVADKKGAEMPDPGYLYHSLAMVKTRSNKTFYIAFYTGIYSGRDIAEGVQAFTIDGDKLTDTAKLFKTAQGSVHNISYAYDAMDSGNEDKDGNRYTIHLNKEQTKLYVPLINAENKFTGKWLIYVFDGEQFVYNKNATY